MLKRHMAVCLLATAMAGGAAFAQSTTAPSSPAPEAPATTAPSSPAPAAPGGSSSATSSSAASTSAAGGAQFVTEQPASTWLASKLAGLDVYGSDNAKIGDITEVLVNKEGAAETVIVGVGGFLGIGQKNVAVPFKSVQWMDTPPSAGAAKTTSTDTTGSTSTTTSAPSSSSSSSSTDSATRGYPDHAMIKATKDELQNAPTFRYASEARAASSTGGSSPTPPMGGATQKQ